MAILKSTSSARILVWPLDPFSGHRPLNVKVLKVLRGLTESLGYRILPVYVLSPSVLRLPVDLKSDRVGQLRKICYSALKRELTLIGASDLEPEILFEPKNSLVATARRLASWAKKNRKVAGIALATTAKKTYVRLFVGSFAEKLMDECRVPLLLMNPHTQLPHAVTRVVFATDFSAGSKRVFERFVQSHKQSVQAITLVHAVQEVPAFQTTSIEPWLPSALIYMPELVKAHLKAIEKSAKKWSQWAQSKGVKTSYRLDKKATSVEEGIQRLAKEVKADWIAMAAESSGLSASMLGSTTRKLVRTSSLPIWIQRA